jgi:hypothetical protein
MSSEAAVRQAIRNLAEMRQAKVNAVITGSSDVGAYKISCGEIHGLDLAIEELKAVLQKVEGDDDNDD